MKRRGTTLASKSDPLELYQRAVQQPRRDVGLFQRIWRRHHGPGTPLVLREDFCGAAAVSCAWVRSHPERTARGIDLDTKVLVWGAVNNQMRLPKGARERLQLVQGDVRRVMSPKADVVAAQNFSFCVFKARKDLVAYFRHARRNVKRKGVFVLDVLGGFETQQSPRREPRKEDGFVYVWEHRRFDPVNQNGIFAIHFEFGDGSALRDAFVYDWRMWTIPEVREALVEAGFRTTEVWWEEDDGSWRPRTSAPPDAVWLAMVVGIP